MASGDPTFGDEWIPPLDCLECNHQSKLTRRYCSTCKGPYYCIHCNGKIVDPVPELPPDTTPPPPPDSPPPSDTLPPPTGDP